MPLRPALRRRAEVPEQHPHSNGVSFSVVGKLYNIWCHGQRRIQCMCEQVGVPLTCAVVTFASETSICASSAFWLLLHLCSIACSDGWRHVKIQTSHARWHLARHHALCWNLCLLHGLCRLESCSRDRLVIGNLHEARCGDVLVLAPDFELSGTGKDDALVVKHLSLAAARLNSC